MRRTTVPIRVAVAASLGLALAACASFGRAPEESGPVYELTDRIVVLIPLESGRGVIEAQAEADVRCGAGARFEREEVRFPRRFARFDCGPSPAAIKA